MLSSNSKEYSDERNTLITWNVFLPCYDNWTLLSFSHPCSEHLQLIFCFLTLFIQWHNVKTCSIWSGKYVLSVSFITFLQLPKWYWLIMISDTVFYWFANGDILLSKLRNQIKSAESDKKGFKWNVRFQKKYIKVLKTITILGTHIKVLKRR